MGSGAGGGGGRQQQRRGGAWGWQPDAIQRCRPVAIARAQAAGQGRPHRQRQSPPGVQRAETFATINLAARDCSAQRLVPQELEEVAAAMLAPGRGAAPAGGGMQRCVMQRRSALPIAAHRPCAGNHIHIDTASIRPPACGQASEQQRDAACRGGTQRRHHRGLLAPPPHLQRIQSISGCLNCIKALAESNQSACKPAPITQNAMAGAVDEVSHGCRQPAAREGGHEASGALVASHQPSQHRSRRRRCRHRCRVTNHI